jgi:hypothetical protein
MSIAFFKLVACPSINICRQRLNGQMRRIDAQAVATQVTDQVISAQCSP